MDYILNLEGLFLLSTNKNWLLRVYLFLEASRFSFHYCLALEVYEKIRMVIENKAAMLGFILFGQSALSEREILTLLMVTVILHLSDGDHQIRILVQVIYLGGGSRWFQETPGRKWDREVQETNEV